MDSLPVETLGSTKNGEISIERNKCVYLGLDCFSCELDMEEKKKTPRIAKCREQGSDSAQNSAPVLTNLSCGKVCPLSSAIQQAQRTGAACAQKLRIANDAQNSNRQD